MSYGERQPTRARRATSVPRLTSAADDLRAVDPLGRISRVDDQLRLADNPLIVVVGMVGDDQHAIKLAQVVQGGAFHLEVVFAAFSHRGKKGIVVAHCGSLLLQE